MADAAGQGGLIRVIVAWSPGPREVVERQVEMPVASTVADALRAAGIDIDGDYQASVWGRAAPMDQPVRQGDRVEWLRPLRVDPKVARRERFQRQGARTAGLFSKKQRR